MATLTSFTLFSLFSSDIRLLIWKAALPPPRHITTTAILLDEEINKRPLLLACKESSAVFLLQYTPVLYGCYGDRSIHVDLQHDTFFKSVLLPYGYGELSLPEEKGVRISGISNPMFRLKSDFTDILPRILMYHPHIEVLHIVVAEVARDGITEGERPNYLRWLKRSYEAVAWGKKENLRSYWDSRWVVNELRELRLSFDISQLIDGRIHSWKYVDAENVVGELDKDLAAKWDI